MSSRPQNRKPAGRPSGGEYAPTERTESDVQLGPTPGDEGGDNAFVRVRHSSAPAPNSCRWCGRERGSHGLFFARSVGNHYYAEPTPQQRMARMRARRASTGQPTE